VSVKSNVAASRQLQLRESRCVVLIAFSVLVIGLVDNILRPILVGKDTKMPRLRRPDLHLGRPGDFRSQRLCDRASGRGDVYSCVGYCRFIKGGSA
jgi:hypothetical protein